MIFVTYTKDNNMNNSKIENGQPTLQQHNVSSSASVVDEWTCSCLYKCNDCLKVEAEGGNKREYFEKKNLDYWDEYSS